MSNIDHHQSLIMYFVYDLMEAYSEALEAAPVTTKALTSATVYTIGDIIAQRSEGADRLDVKRVTRSLLAGLLGHGPLSHVWYYWSEDLFQSYLGWTSWWVVFPKVILDQTTWAPFWNNVYIIMLGVMQCQPLSTIWGDIRRTTIPLIVSGLKLWPMAHIITYGYVNVENRLLWVDVVEIVWVTILATQAAGKTKVRRKKKKVAEAAANQKYNDEEDPNIGSNNSSALHQTSFDEGLKNDGGMMMRMTSSDNNLLEIPEIKVQ